MYFCEWCETRTQETVPYVHDVSVCDSETPSHEDHCDRCGWYAENQCPVCEGVVVELDFSIYNRSQDTSESQEIFGGWVSTAELFGVFVARRNTGDQDRADFQAGLWNRGSICRALAARGVTQKMINFMKS